MAKTRLQLLLTLRSAGIAALVLLSAACGAGTDSQAPVLPPVIVISPALVTTTVGAEFTFTASVERATDPTLKWSALRGTITEDGAYTAPSTQGEDMVTAVLVADPSISKTARVVINPPPVVSMAISPLEPTITVGASKLFIARVLGGDSSAVSWSVEVPTGSSADGFGSISSDGLYTAPKAVPVPNGTVKIVATTQASGKQLTASTTITVTLEPEQRLDIVDGSSDPNIPVVNGETRYFYAQLTNISLAEVSWSIVGFDVLPDPAYNSLPMPTVTPIGEYTQFTGSGRPGGYDLYAVAKDRSTGKFIAEGLYFVNVAAVHVCIDPGSPPTDTVTVCAGDGATTIPAVSVSARGSQQFSARVTTAAVIPVYAQPTDVTPVDYVFFEGTDTAPVPGRLGWTWSVLESTGGTVTDGPSPGTATYTAPVRGGTYHVKATVDQYNELRSASAAVLVNGVKVTIDPSATEVRAGSTVDLTATVTDVVSADGDVTWLIQEGSAGGTFTAFPSTATSATSATSRATYTAPSTGGGKTYHVIATSNADSSVRATATIRVLGVWTSVAAGGHHTVAVKSDGTLWAWGNNYFGQLGDGTTINRLKPVQIGSDKNWDAVAAGADYTVALKGDLQGVSLYAWGANAYGQLGDGTFTDRNAPIQIGVNYEWKAVSARGRHTVAIKHDGTLWAWGDNTFGQVGDGGGSVQPVPTEIVAKDGNGTLLPLTWATVAAGTGHTLAIATDGSLWAWGRNTAGQLGDMTDPNVQPVDRLVPTRVGTDNDWIAVDAGALHSVGVRRQTVDGAVESTLWVWGDNNEGQLGDASVTASPVPVRLGLDTTWTRVFAGEYHTMAVKADQTLWGWGRNARGELGIAQSLSGKESAPVQVGSANFLWAAADSGLAHTVMLTADGRLFVVGANPEGAIGNDTVADKLVPVRVGGAVANWAGANLASGRHHSAAIDSDGRLWTWGSNAYGQLGDGTRVDRDVPVQIPAGSGLTWLKVSAGAAHTVAIRSDQRMLTWGDNSLGQLGRGLGANGEQCPAAPAPCGAHTPGEIPLQISQYPRADAWPWVGVAAGAFHTVAITNYGSLWAWGANAFGQVGNGVSSITEPFPVLIEESVGSYGQPYQKWVAVAAGGDHSVGIMEKSDNGSSATWALSAWGRNNVGQLGEGTLTDQSVPTLVPILVPGTDRMFTDWRSVSAGLDHSFAMNSSGELWGWGSNLTGQLGNGTYGTISPPMRPDPAAWSSAFGGGSHSVGIMPDGTLWTWGLNSEGQLGNGTRDNRLIQTQVGVGSDWASAAAGLGHTLAVTLESDGAGTLWAWGDNDMGQLGDGTAWIEIPVEIN